MKDFSFARKREIEILSPVNSSKQKAVLNHKVNSLGPIETHLGKLAQKTRLANKEKDFWQLVLLAVVGVFSLIAVLWPS